MTITRKLHPKGITTSQERLRAAINLQVTDGFPVSPLICCFAAHYVGIDWTWNKSIGKVFDDLGPWDVMGLID